MTDRTQAQRAAIVKGRERIAYLATKDGEHRFAREVLAGCWDHRPDVAQAIGEEYDPADDAY